MCLLFRSRLRFLTDADDQHTQDACHQVSSQQTTRLKFVDSTLLFVAKRAFLKKLLSKPKGADAKPTKMKLIATILLSMACLSAAFQVQPRGAVATTHKIAGATTPTSLFGFMPEPEREKLTRDSEPEDFFAT